MNLEGFKRSEKGIENDLLRHDLDRRLGVARAVINIKAPDIGVAAGFAHHSGQYVDQRGLARAIGTQKAEDGAARNIETNVIERLFSVGVGFGKILDAASVIFVA